MSPAYRPMPPNIARARTSLTADNWSKTKSRNGSDDRIDRSRPRDGRDAFDLGMTGYQRTRYAQSAIPAARRQDSVDHRPSSRFPLQRRDVLWLLKDRGDGSPPSPFGLRRD